MPCTIQDVYQSVGSDGTAAALGGQPVYAVPASNLYRVLSGGSYRPLGPNAAIPVVAYQFGRRSVTNAAGQFNFVLPYGVTETKPTSPLPQWSVVFPDGRVLTGVVPTVAGPLLMDDLISTYGWTWTAGAVYQAPTSGVDARGTATFSGQDSVAVVLSPTMVSAGYTIELTPSVDTSTGAIPVVGWDSKAAGGFTIKAAGLFTGSVDWRIKL